MEWSPILYGCFVSRGTSYAFDISYERDPAVCKSYLTTNIAVDSWLAGRTERSVFFGQCGRVGDRIGWDTAGARDRSGRRLEFFLGYVAPAGTQLPGLRDLVGLRQRVDHDLSRLAQQLQQSRQRLSFGEPVVLSNFGRNSDSEASWDRTVAEFSSGRHHPGIVVQTVDGAQSVIPLQAPTCADKSSDHSSAPGRPATDPIDALIQEKQRRAADAGLPKALITAVVAAALGVIGLLTMHHF